MQVQFDLLDELLYFFIFYFWEKIAWFLFCFVKVEETIF